MNAIEKLCSALKREFPKASVSLYSPDDEDNGTWRIRAFQGDEDLTVEWHAGLGLMGVSHAHVGPRFPDEILSIPRAGEWAREALRH